MRVRELLPLLMLSLLPSGWLTPAEAAASRLAMHIGLGASAGLESGSTPTSGLAVHASGLIPVHHPFFLGLTIDRHHSGLRSGAGHETEFETTSLAASLACRLEGASGAGYLRTGFGAGYTHRLLLRPGPDSQFAVLEDREDFAPCGQLAVGAELKLASALTGFADFGVYQVWGTLSNTAAALVLGVATGW